MTKNLTERTYRFAPSLQDGKPVVGIHCIHCEKWVTREYWMSSDDGSLDCEYCGTTLTFFDSIIIDEDAELSIVADDAELYYAEDEEFASEVICERVWFHITAESDWLSQDNASRGHHFPHIGSLETVTDLYRQQYDGKEMTLHAVRVSKYAVMMPGKAIDDAVQGWETIMLEDVAGAEVVRYVNMYEHPGAVSLVTVPDVLTSLASMKFSGSEGLKVAADTLVNSLTLSL